MSAGQDNGAESRTPAQIEADIELQRQQLAGTIDALTAKLDVKGQAQAKVNQARERVSPDVVAGVAAVAAMLLLTWVLRRRS